MYERAYKALQALYSDISVSREATRAYLLQLRDEIDIWLDALDK